MFYIVDYQEKSNIFTNSIIKILAIYKSLFINYLINNLHNSSIKKVV